MGESRWDLTFLQGLIVALLAIMVPNCIMSVLAYWVGVDRVFINFDYAILVFLSLFVPSFIIMLVFSLVFLSDALALICQIFPVINISDFLYISKFFPLAPLGYKLAIGAGCVLFVGLAFGYYRIRPLYEKGSALLVINAAVFMYVISVFFIDSYAGNYRKAPKGVVINSQMVFNYEARGLGFLARFDEEIQPFEKAEKIGATSKWFDDLDAVGDKALLVLSESWGVPSPDIQEALLSPIKKSSSVMNFDYGVIDFLGVTVQGEIRELCSMRSSGVNVADLDEGWEHCLPRKLDELGYETVAMHGAVGAMYERKDWYPKAGFSKQVFFESKAWPRRCYSFPGACDADMAGEIESALLGSKKKFVYWLTLNSHASYDLRDLDVDVFDCGDYAVPKGSQSCHNLKLHAQFFYYLSELVSRPDMKGLNVIVVGDHQPPIYDQKDKRQYFDERKVPWVSFSVK